MSTETLLRQLIAEGLQNHGTDTVDGFIENARSEGKSWRKIRAEIWDLTGRPVSVPTLIDWHETHKRSSRNTK